MNSFDLKQIVKDTLLTLEPSKDNDDGVTIRCPCCGDSMKNQSSMHFHVKIDLDDDDMPLIYHCFRCDESGILNSDILRSLGIFDIELNSKVKSYNKHAIKKGNKKGLTRYSKKMSVVLPYPKNLELAEIKRDYINNRLGTDFSIEQLVALKIVLNFADYVRENEITQLKMYKSFINTLHYDYVGFISTNNDFIQFRDTTNKNKYRYYNYNVYNLIDKSRNFYSIPNKIDLMTSEPVEIILSEGIFDILGVFSHIYKFDLKNKVYSAVCGCGFLSVVKYYLRRGLFGNNVTISIFSDQDKPPSFFTQLNQELKDWVKEINLYYNCKSKDCGVRPEKIEIVKKKIPRNNYGGNK